MNKNDIYLDPGDLIKDQNTDAQAWAKSFMSTMECGYFKPEEIDEGLMISWFANVMMTMYDNVHGHYQKLKVKEGM